MQTYPRKETVPRNLIDSADILLKKVSQVGMAERLGGWPNSVRIRKELPLLGVMRVHPAKQLAQGRPIIARIANGEIKQNSQQLPLVVVGNTALGKAVVGIFLQPRVHAGILYRLGELGRPTLQLSNFLRKMIQIMPLVQHSSPQPDVLPNRAVHAFAEPQRGGEILLCVVDGLKRLRANALDVPQMEELVRGNPREALRIVSDILRRQRDRGAVSM